MWTFCLIVWGLAMLALLGAIVDKLDSLAHALRAYLLRH